MNIYSVVIEVYQKGGKGFFGKKQDELKGRFQHLITAATPELAIAAMKEAIPENARTDEWYSGVKVKLLGSALK